MFAQSCSARYPVYGSLRFLSCAIAHSECSSHYSRVQCPRFLEIDWSHRLRSAGCYFFNPPEPPSIYTLLHQGPICRLQICPMNNSSLMCVLPSKQALIAGMAASLTARPTTVPSLYDFTVTILRQYPEDADKVVLNINCGLGPSITDLGMETLKPIEGRFAHFLS